MPTPLKTILSATRYPYAVAYVQDGKITHTVGYATTLEDCYFQVQGWRGVWRWRDADYIMVEMREIGESTPDRVNTYWCAV